MRFFGAVWISERSRTPISDMCSVRGIGVAESVRTSTLGAILLEALLVHDAEALLLVDDDQAEVGEGDVLLQQPMRADDDVDLALREVAQDPFLVGLGREARKLFDAHGKGAESRAERAVVLIGEQRRRHEHRDLLLVGDRLERGAHRDFGLAVADVAADQAIHRPRALHVGFRRVDGLLLVGRRLVRERLLHLALPRRVGTESEAARHLALGIERDELVGDLRQRFGDARLRARPIGAAHLGEARRLPFGGRVLRDLMHLRDGHQHPVAARIAQVEIVLRRAEDRLGAQAEILADAVHRVHDVIADAQVGQRDRDAFLDARILTRLGGAPKISRSPSTRSVQAAGSRSPTRSTRDRRRRRRASARPGSIPAARSRSIVRETPALTMKTVSPVAIHSRSASREERDLPVEMFDGTAFEDERLERPAAPNRSRARATSIAPGRTSVA